MSEADEKESQRTPKVHYAEAKMSVLRGVRLIVKAKRIRTIDLDCPVPSGLDWLKNELDLMKAAPDCPKTITPAAHRLEGEMEEAFRRRQVDEHWGWGHIKNTMITLELWGRTRPAAAILKRRPKRRPKRIAPRSKKARGR
jgi:hypothetical protein